MGVVSHRIYAALVGAEQHLAKTGGCDVSLKDSTLAYLLRPRVVHELPGRMRIHLPLLDRLPSENGDTVDMVARLLSVPQGVEEVSPCLITGNVLIRYDSRRLTAQEVLHYLTAITQLVVRNHDRFEIMTAGHFHQCEERLRGWLSAKLSYRLELDGNVRIPDHVLA
jgi:hypothetical protein